MQSNVSLFLFLTAHFSSLAASTPTTTTPSPIDSSLSLPADTASPDLPLQTSITDAVTTNGSEFPDLDHTQTSTDSYREASESTTTDVPPFTNNATIPSTSLSLSPHPFNGTSTTAAPRPTSSSEGEEEEGGEGDAHSTESRASTRTRTESNPTSTNGALPAASHAHLSRFGLAVFGVAVFAVAGLES
ncbi:hypothetical protein P885DRAFT_77599 [Corynascus similis CBS 632.67]